MWVGCHQTTLWICSNGGSQARPEVNAPMVQLYRSVIQRRARTRRMSRGLGRPMRRSTRLHHLQSCGTLERSDAPNDKTTRRRCWNRHLGLRHCHRSMRRLSRGSPSQATSRVRSSTWTTLNFRGCSRPLPSRSQLRSDERSAGLVFLLYQKGRDSNLYQKGREG